MKYYVPLALMLCLSSITLFGQFSINVQDATDGECNGSAELVIENDNKLYSYLWSNGGNEMNIDKVCPGNYSVTITSLDGCEWVLNAIISGKNGCYLENEEIVANIHHPCDKEGGSISIEVNSPIEYKYDWSNKKKGNYIENLTDGEYCVTITSLWQENCMIESCYKLSKEACSSQYNNPILMINEVSNGENGDDEYVELLVLGDGNCKEPVDLQGFILDDNNGDFSMDPRGSRSITPYSLRFVRNRSWEAVPIGSLIVIYNEKNKNSSIRLKDDPNDIDNNHVYVLSASSDYFERCDYSSFSSGNQVTINPSKFKTPKQEPEWSVVDMLNAGDAMQVRYPDTKYCHGVSYGNPSRITGGPDDLFIAPLNGLSRVVFFDGSIPTEAKDFKMVDIKANTPGSPNSENNAAFISRLCSRESVSYTSSYTYANAKVLSTSVLPNPFRNEFELNFEINKTTLVDVILQDILGRQVLHNILSVDEGNNSIRFDGLSDLKSGVYILVVNDGASQIIQTRIVKI